MARDETELIGCEACGSLNERATALLAERDDTIADLERELRAKRAKITRLESERHDKLIRHRKYEDAMEVLRHWQSVCAPNAKEIDSTERLEKVIARLSGGHTVAELKLCATGYAKRPYVTANGRSSHGTPKEWQADAELIYRTPGHVTRGIAYAATSTEPTTSPLSAGSVERLSWRRVQYENRKLIIRALTERFGPPLENDSMIAGGWLVSPCPRCDNDPALTLTIAPPGMSYIVNCHTCGLTETQLIAAITEDKQDGNND